MKYIENPYIPETFVLTRIIGLAILVSLMCMTVALACDDGDTLSCKTYDGKVGVKVCVQAKWSGCSTTTSGTNSGDGDSGAGTAAEPILCPADRKVVEISGLGDRNERDRQRACFIKSLGSSNTIVRLGPNVDFDFSATHDVTGKVVELFNYPVSLGACVTIESAAQLTGTIPCPETLTGGVVVPPQPAARLRNVSAALNTVHMSPLLPPLESQSARSSRSLGPVLRFGDHAGSPIDGATAFLQIGCDAQVNGNGDKIRGFRIYGPTFEDQHDNNYVGIRVANCVAAEIENMEVAGWGGEAIEVNFGALDSIPISWPNPFWVRIHGNYLHHNLHTSYNGHSAGYGVDTSRNAFSLIYQNVLDYNNHDLTADGKAGGYIAQQNLVLKGGGLHSTGPFGYYMHVFDVHGDQKSCPPSGDYTCGNAARFNMLENTFQYKNSDDIGVRGKVRGESFIQHNIFARSSERAAIDLFDDTGIHVDHNSYNIDTYGQYATCDFDGDGVDDLFLATGVTWWFSSAAQFPWTFLRADSNLTDAVALGDFDGDHRCDVLEEVSTQKGVWYIARAGKSPLEPLAKDAYGHAVDFGHPLSEVRFGRFDPSKRDHRVGVIKSLTHAFWRSPQGEWFITPLDKVDWQYIGGSSFPLSALKFGDFDGDGVTDVLAVESGHWAYSSAGRKPWKRLNSALGEPVADLIVLNTDTDDNIDDLLKLEVRTLPTDPAHPSPTSVHTTITWWRSRNGMEPWVAWKHYEYTCNPHDPNVALACGTSYAGHFAAIPGDHVIPIDPKRAGAGVLAIDPWRVGHFYNPGESVNGRPVEWTSNSEQFKY